MNAAVIEVEPTDLEAALATAYERPTDLVPPALRSDVTAALEAEQLAREKLQQRNQEVERDQQSADLYRERAETAKAAIESNADVLVAETLAKECLIAEAKLTATRNVLRESTNALSLARAEHQAAENEVRKVYRRVNQAGVNDIAATARVHWEGFEKAVRLLFAAQLRNVVTRAGASILNADPAKYVTGLFNPGVLRDINTPMGGSPQLLKEILAEFDQLCAAWQDSCVGDPVETGAQPEVPQDTAA